MPIVTSLLVVIAVLGWSLAIKKHTRTPWKLQNSDVALNTRYGPIILRTIDSRETYSELKGFIIFPSGSIVNDHFNSMLGQVMPMHVLDIESLPSVPNSYRVCTRNPKDDERFGAVLEATAEVINTRFATR